MNNYHNIVLLNSIISHGSVVYDQDRTMRLDYEQKILHRAIDFKAQRRMVMGV